jgi:hypothetical protein
MVGKGETDHVEDDGVHFRMDHIGYRRSLLRSRKPRRWQEERAERFHLVDLISTLSQLLLLQSVLDQSTAAQSHHRNSIQLQKLALSHQLVHGKQEQKVVFTIQ